MLEDYVVETVTYATEGGLGEVEFEKNHRGENDVALFDFTSMYAAENASRIIERKGKRILLCIAGDALLQVCTCNVMYLVVILQKNISSVYTEH